MVNRFNIEDFEEVSSNESLLRFKNKHDGTMYSVKSLIVDKDFKPETHGVITTAMQLKNHKSFPKVYGYATRMGEDYMEILVFIEFAVGTLGEIAKKQPLSQKELSNLLNMLIDTFLDIDRNAYMTPPSYLTPYNIVVYDGMQGREFKIFGIMPHAETRPIPDQFLLYTSPE